MKKIITKRELQRIAYKFKKANTPKDKEHLLKQNYWVRVKDNVWKIGCIIFGVSIVTAGGFLSQSIKSSTTSAVVIFISIVLGIIAIVIGIKGRWTRLEKVHDRLRLLDKGKDIGYISYDVIAFPKLIKTGKSDFSHTSEVIENVLHAGEIVVDVLDVVLDFVDIDL